MEPKIYEERARHKSLPLDFQYQDAAGYDSNWSYIVDKFSNYSFDKWAVEKDGDWFNHLGHFTLPEEVKALIPSMIEESKAVGWFDVTSSNHPGFPGATSPLLAIEENDRIAAGQDGKEFVQVVPEPAIVHTAIQALGEYWKLKRCRTRLHVQWPGQMFPIHIDKLWHRYPADPAKIIRFVISMTDYEPGQLMLYGNHVFTQWREGAVHCFDTLNVPHATCNMSRTPRVSMIVTGVRTEETDEILRRSNFDTIHTV